MVRRGCVGAGGRAPVAGVETAVYGWRKRWRAGGEQALASKGPGGSRCRLDEGRLRRLADALEQGPAAHGFGSDQRWTLARVSDLIARMVRTRVHVAGDGEHHVPVGLVGAGTEARCGRADEAATPCGGGRRGRRENGSGAVAGAADLRRRGRSNAAPTEGTHLGTTRARPRGSGVGQGPLSGLDRRADLLPARAAVPVHHRTIAHRGRKYERRSFSDATTSPCWMPPTNNSTARSCASGTT
ncbi:helix-turn-helix domain-containing protein [Micromonospora noduli]|uniref:helix-turn-helix domain-containing protein n=1 Tax=Micromonospora noduli TaxID=709876 RepID=UPI0034DAF993